MSTKIIYGILNASAPVTALTGDRIYPGIAKQFDIGPFIVYFKVSTNPADSKDGPSKLDTLRVQVSIFHNDYDALEDLAGKVRTALDRYSGPVGGVEVQSIRFIDENELRDPDTDYFHTAQDYSIRIKR